MGYSAGNPAEHTHTHTHTERICSFEWMRVFCAVAVVCIHVTQGLMTNYPIEELGVVRVFVWTETQMLLCRWAVPIFLMISGALLLNPAKKVTWGKAFQYIKRMLLVLATFGLLYCLMESYFNYRVVSLSMLCSALLNLVQGNSWSHMWYVYTLIGIYLLLPVIKAFIDQSSKKDIRCLLLILFVCCAVIPTFNAAWDTKIETFVWLPVSVFYFILGYYAFTYLKLNRAVVILGISAGVASFCWRAFLVLYQNFYGDFLGQDSFLTAIWACFLFVAAREWLERPCRQGGVVETLSGLSFGIYLIHPLFLNIIYKVLNVTPNLLPPGVFEIVMFTSVFALSAISTWLLKRCRLSKALYRGLRLRRWRRRRGLLSRVVFNIRPNRGSMYLSRP